MIDLDAIKVSIDVGSIGKADERARVRVTDLNALKDEVLRLRGFERKLGLIAEALGCDVDELPYRLMILLARKE